MNPSRMSFPEIVMMYQKKLYWYIRRTVLVHEDSEDILQETFIKAYRHLWSLRNPEALESWLYRIATNEINRHFKKKKAAAGIDCIPDTELTASESVRPEDASEIISSAILRMSPLQREVFCLKYYEDRDYDEISRITGSDKNTLMVCYHEAKKKIEKEINR